MVEDNLNVSTQEQRLLLFFTKLYCQIVSVVFLADELIVLVVEYLRDVHALAFKNCEGWIAAST